MAIPNVKRFRPFCTTCKESFTVMAVIPRELTWIISGRCRGPSRSQGFPGCEEPAHQGPRRSAEAEESEVVFYSVYRRARSDLRARKPSWATRLSGSRLSLSSQGTAVASPLTASIRASWIFSSLVPVSSGWCSAASTAGRARLQLDRPMAVFAPGRGVQRVEQIAEWSALGRYPDFRRESARKPMPDGAASCHRLSRPFDGGAIPGIADTAQALHRSGAQPIVLRCEVALENARSTGSGIIAIALSAERSALLPRGLATIPRSAGSPSRPAKGPHPRWLPTGYGRPDRAANK